MIRTIPHSRRNPPTKAAETGTKGDEFKFVAVRPQRPGQVPASMAKRPVGKA
jgi:hypothetical protein